MRGGPSSYAIPYHIVVCLKPVHYKKTFSTHQYYSFCGWNAILDRLRASRYARSALGATH